MKILVLTSTDSEGEKVYLILDKIVAYHKENESTAVRMMEGSFYFVRESPEFITNQLVDADASSYVVYNSKEYK